MFAYIFIFPISEIRSFTAKKQWLPLPLDSTNVPGAFLSLNTQWEFSRKFTQPRAFLWFLLFMSSLSSGFSVSNICNSVYQTQVTTSYFSLCCVVSCNETLIASNIVLSMGEEQVGDHIMHLKIPAVCRGHFYYLGCHFHRMNLCRGGIIILPLSFWGLSWYLCSKRQSRHKKDKAKSISMYSSWICETYPGTNE